MGVLIFPFLGAMFLGQCFDLVDFQFNLVNPYLGIQLKDYTTRTPINTLESKFRVVSTPADLATFLGMNIIIYLKKEYNLWPYGPSKYFLNTPRRNRFDKVTIAVRMNLKTDKETIPADTPVNGDWESKQRDFGGTHYLKSFIHGAEVQAIIEIGSKNRSHFEEIKRRVEREIGSSGNFDEDFKEKLDSVVEEMGTWYGLPSTSAYGMNSDFFLNLPKLLQLKNNLQGNRSLVVENVRILYEFHSLSKISSIPPVQTKREFLEQAARLLIIREDIVIARDELNYFFRYEMPDLTEEEEVEFSELFSEIDSLGKDIAVLATDIDVTTDGDIHQFDNIFLNYGSDGTEKYRKRVRELISRTTRRE
ncbi:uncharacterized protein LOC111619279 [Centruroides sculpturatus]|uniref:uncharacterized protein LOC111619279 n=1 Tax=Centruroides sculpturatus TaxID=218467 RepID=UPI000C6EE6E2|nr:uncharacterized protein LOC111619279 [Centruroides sculpturatus]